MSKDTLQIIYWRTIREEGVGSLVHIVWEDTNGRVFGRGILLSFILRIKGRISWAPMLYEHVGPAQGASLLLGCEDAIRFYRDMPKNIKRLPNYHYTVGSGRDYSAVTRYIYNTWKRYPKVRKAGYLWKCDE